MKVFICSIIKNENVYLREWTEHYKKLGFDHIYLYDNNDIDGEHPQDVIQDYIDEGFIEVNEMFRGHMTQPDEPVAYCQRTAYWLCYSRHMKEYDYMFICDIDEHLHLLKHKDVHEFLSSNTDFSKYDCIDVCWRNVGDNGLVRIIDNDYSLANRFVKPLSMSNFYKSFIKCKERDMSAIWFSCHSIWTLENLKKSLKYIYSTGRIKHCHVNGNFNNNILYDAPTMGPKPVGEGIAELWHYRFKTIEEFITIKTKNWLCYQKQVLQNYINIPNFFRQNKKTEEKIRYIDEYIQACDNPAIKQILTQQMKHVKR